MARHGHSALITPPQTANVFDPDRQKSQRETCKDDPFVSNVRILKCPDPIIASRALNNFYMAIKITEYGQH